MGAAGGGGGWGSGGDLVIGCGPLLRRSFATSPSRGQQTLPAGQLQLSPNPKLLDFLAPQWGGARVVVFLTGGAWIIGYKAWAALMGKVLKAEDPVIVERFTGAELVGKRYEPMMPATPT